MSRADTFQDATTCSQRDSPARGDGAPRLLEDEAMTDALVDDV
jgi:hypothetical protein